MNAAPCLYSYYVAYVTHTSLRYNSFVNTLHFNLFALKVQMLLMFPGEVTLRVQLYRAFFSHDNSSASTATPHRSHTNWQRHVLQELNRIFTCFQFNWSGPLSAPRIQLTLAAFHVSGQLSSFHVFKTKHLISYAGPKLRFCSVLGIYCFRVNWLNLISLFSWQMRLLQCLDFR